MSPCRHRNTVFQLVPPCVLQEPLSGKTSLNNGPQSHLLTLPLPNSVSLCNGDIRSTNWVSKLRNALNRVF